MAILVNRETRLVVQGITGREGEFHAYVQCRALNTGVWSSG